jgi:hypothetical protein
MLKYFPFLPNSAKIGSKRFNEKWIEQLPLNSTPTNDHRIPY